MYMGYHLSFCLFITWVQPSVWRWGVVNSYQPPTPATLRKDRKPSAFTLQFLHFSALITHTHTPLDLSWILFTLTYVVIHMIRTILWPLYLVSPMFSIIIANKYLLQ